MQWILDHVTRARVSMVTCDWAASLVLWRAIHVIITLQRVTGSVEEGTLLRVATIQREPFVYLRWEPGLIANDRYEGMYIDLLKELSRESGFRYQLYLVPDGRIGQAGDDGRWNGLIGELERGTADLVLTPVINTPERQHIISFTEPLSAVQISALTRKQTEGGQAPAPSPYGIVVSSEAFYALRTYPNLFDSLRQSHGLIYVNSLMEGLDRAREGHLRLLVTSQLADYYMDQEPCDLVAEDFHSFPPSDLGISLAMRADSPLHSRINSALHRIKMATPLLDTLEDRWLRGSCSRGGTLPTLTDTTTDTGQEENRRQLVIASVVTEPYLMRSNKRGVEFEGYIADLIRQMARVVPFDYEWKIQRQFGRQRRDGSWSGVVGDLLDQKADMAAAPFISDASQEDFLSFSKPFLESTLSVLLQAPPPGRNLPIVMAEDLLNQSAYDFGIVHKSRVAKQLKRSELPLYKKLWKELKVKDRENKILTISHGLDRVRAGNFALLMESPEATYLSSRFPCDLLSLSQYLSVTNYAFALKKDSPLVNDLNNALVKLQQDGVLQALFHKWWNTDECLEFHRTRVPTDSSTTVNSTEATTPVPLQPVLDFDLDAMLGLSTEPYREDAYDDTDGSDDMDRIFLTSPVSAFTPKRAKKTTTQQTTTEIPAPSVTQTIPWRGITSTHNNHMDDNQNKTDMEEIPIRAPDDREEDSDESRDRDVIFYTVPTTSPIYPSTPRRRGRTRRPGRRKNKNRKTTPYVTTTPLAVTIPQEPPTPPPDDIHDTPSHPPAPPDFIKDLDWFFATERPRLEDYDYDNYNFSHNDSESYTPFIPQHNFTQPKQDIFTTLTPVNNSQTSKEIYTTSIPKEDIFVKVTENNGVSNTTIVPNIHSSSAPRGGSSKAVLFVVIIHLLIFGWPSTSQDCTDDCNR